jgi:hypothetical protein
MKGFLRIGPFFLLLTVGINGCAVFGTSSVQKKAEGFTGQYCKCLEKAGIETMGDFEKMNEKEAKTLLQCVDRMSDKYTEMKKGKSREELEKLDAELEKALEKAPCKGIIEEMMSY